MGADPGDVEMIRFVLLLLAATPPLRPRRSRGPWPLTPEGYGPARIGMTRAQVERALVDPARGRAARAHRRLHRDGRTARRPRHRLHVPGRPAGPDPVGAGSQVRTPRGIGVGATAAQVRRAYPRGLLAEEHTYTGAPAEYLTFWVRRERSGVRFTTDENRRVDSVIAGNGSIQYIEGCA